MKGLRARFDTDVQRVSTRIDNELVTVLLDEQESSAIHLGDPTYLEFEYMQHLDLVARTHFHQRLRALHVGSAACALARAWDAHYRDAMQVCVDIDGQLLEWARETFDLPRAPRLKLRHADAREVLASLSRPRFQIIVIDIFAAGTTPPGFLDSEGITKAKLGLVEEGILAANVTVKPGQACPAIGEFRKHFGHTLAISDPKVWRGARRGNVVLVGSNRPLDISLIEIGLRRLALPARLWVNPPHLGAR